MRKFLILIALFFGVVAVVDVLFGIACDYLNSHAKAGDTDNHYNITMSQTEPVLIMGSSRAIHHYDPAILEDSLGMGVYNCGVDGNGILFQYGRLSLILERYRPRLIIYDAINSFDISRDDAQKNLGWLRRWYGHNSIDSLLEDMSAFELLKLKSSLYRYNGSFMQMLSDNIHPQQEIAYHGFKPLRGIINYEPKKEEEPIAEWLPLKLKYFQKFIETCRANDIGIVMVYSPWYNKTSSETYARLTELCVANDIPVIDYYGGGEFNESRELFKDASHLNENGAALFSKSVASQLRSLVELKR